MKNIDADFKNAQGKAILFLGKFASLSHGEIQLFLEKFDIRYTDTLTPDVAMVIEGTIMSPMEEDMAAQAYNQKIHLYNSGQFEKLYANALNSDSILMSLKLSNNQERLARLLHNQYLDDTLFLKLFAMIDWGDEGMFDNSENMKLATLFAKRFFSKDRFDAATYYSPISIFEVAVLTEDPAVLRVMLELPLIEVKQSRSGIRKPLTHTEAIATNPHADEYTLTRLMRKTDKNIDYFLAGNPSLSPKMIDTVFQRADEETKEAFCQNINLPDQFFQELISHNSLWEYQTITMERLNMRELPVIPACIGENENLSPEVIEILLSHGDEETLQNLAMNPALKRTQLEKLYALGDTALYPYIAANAHTPTEILAKLAEKNDHAIACYLALNTTASQEILEVLFQKDDFEINCSLCLNESLPLPLLQQLQIDTRLLNYLKENKTFTENILNNLGI